MFTWIEGRSRTGAASEASRFSRIATKASSLMPSRICTFVARSSATVVSHAKLCRPGAL
jgi:hypothetical protein